MSYLARQRKILELVRRTEAAVKRTAVERARTAIRAADSGKFGGRADVAFARWSDFDIWLSDDDPPTGIAEQIKTTHRSLSLVQAA